jgi:hypothetical protein
VFASGCSSRSDHIQFADLASRDGESSWVIEPSTGGDADDGAVEVGLAACAEVPLLTHLQTPEMMIVLDRSTSMGQAGRWRSSVSAVRNLTEQLDDVVRFGLTLFPSAFESSTGSSRWLNCLASPKRQTCMGSMPGTDDSSGIRCSPGEITVPVAEKNADAIAAVLNKIRPYGGTPTASTLRGLVDSYADAAADPDAEVQAKYLLLVTDGAPTCPAGQGLETTQADVDATDAAIDALRERNVHSYVIGYGTTGPENEMLERALDGLAARGGTGDERHRPVEDETGLVNELMSITSSITSCDFKLDHAPSRADFVLVRLDGQMLTIDDPNGWRLVGDRTIQLVGTSCERFRNGLRNLTAELVANRHPSCALPQRYLRR